MKALVAAVCLAALFTTGVGAAALTNGHRTASAAPTGATQFPAPSGAPCPQSPAPTPAGIAAAPPDERTDSAAACYYLPLVNVSPTAVTVAVGQTFSFTLEVYYAEYGCDTTWAGHVATDASGHFGPTTYTGGPYSAAGTYYLDVSCGGLGGTTAGRVTVSVTASGGGDPGSGGGAGCTENATNAMHATFISQTGVPSTVTAGQSFTATMTFQNTGVCTWTAANAYRLGSQNPENNCTWGGGCPSRIYLGPTEAIAPGQTKAFTINAVAPTAAGTYGWGWRMVREGINWLGTPTNGTFTSITVTGSVPPQPTTTTTTTTTPTTTTQPPPQYPVLLSGRVLDANGQPAVGSVAAFSDLNGAGATQDQDLLGSTNTDASGNFVLTADPASPEMQRATNDAATYNGGWMNIDVYVESGNTLVYTGIARLLAGGQFLSNSPGAPGDDGMRRTFLMKKGTPGFRAIPPQRGRRLQQLAFCLPQTTVLSTANANAIVGNMHTANNMTGWFRYGRKADTDFGVGVSANGTNWSASGSAHVSNSVSAAVTWNATSEYGYRLLSNFTFQKTKTVCVGIPGLPPEYKIKVKSWNGGATLGQNVHNLDHQCRTKYPANVVSFAPGTKFDRSANSAVNYKAGVTIFGISLSAKSGYSTDVAAHWDFHARNVLCGTTGPPTVALTVLAG